MIEKICVNPPNPCYPCAKLYESSFPADERRHFDDLEALAAAENEMHIKTEYLDGEVLSFIIYWEFKDFIYVEHFAVNEQFRGNGHGGRIFKNFLRNSKKTLVLEVEPPENVIASKRIEFYKRLGMFLLPFSYTQPPYSAEKSPVNMLIMSNKNIKSASEFEEIKSVIFEKVYVV
ncbi:N-acetyltransferase [Bacteroidia bacterium]|nr:N-acetyltransferase [Bacteroidia bacterium]